jgi:hypothetical protein
MANTDTEVNRLTDLTQVYSVLQKDAKQMSQDLIEGVSMWKSAAIISILLASLAGAVGAVFLAYFGVNQAVIAVNVAAKTKYSYEEFRFEALLIVTFLFAVAAVAGVAGVRYYGRFSELRKKYSDLYRIVSDQS